MDQASALKILQNYGAPMTPRNLMMVMDEKNGGEGLLAKSMGLAPTEQDGRQLDDSNLKNMLDKVDASTQRTAPPPLVIPEQGTPDNVTPLPTARRAVTQPNPALPQDVPPITSADFGGAKPATQGGTGFAPWLLSALGISSVAGRAAMKPGAGTTPNGTSNVDTMGNITGPSDPVANDAVDKIVSDTGSRRPINTNSDERNSEPVNKPVNIDTTPPRPDDSQPTNLVEEVAKTMKKLGRARRF